MRDMVTYGVLAAPVGPLDRCGFAKLHVMPELKAIVKLRCLGPVLKWAMGFEIQKARKDMSTDLEGMAGSDARTFSPTPRSGRFEANFAAGMEQGPVGMYESTRLMG
jgi:hypothetical protein